MSKLGGRIVQLIPALAIEVAIWVLLITTFSQYALQIRLCATVLALIFVIIIETRIDEGIYKETWIILIFVVPLFGIILYLLFGNKRTGKKLKKKINESRTGLDYHFPESTAYDELEKFSKRLLGNLKAVSRYTGMPLYHNDGTRYYKLGEDAFPDMVADMRNAKKYIFVEYFIFERGEFEGTITEVMAEKAAEGVDVRVMYDDLGSIATFSKANVQWLKDRGIKVVTFNPMNHLTLMVNNRDHRKMTVIDGEIAYSGGINIADEYINAKEKYGHWKDTSFRVTGDAVINYAYMFTEFWNAFSEDKIPKEYLATECKNDGKDGVILSYYEHPVRKHHITNSLYIEMLEKAHEYFWVFTPYLMLGDNLQAAFIRAAVAGVDVRIIVPGIPDKKIAYRMTRSNYRPLLEAGVKIYEYTPGFVHAKSLVSDDKFAAIGTVNLDFRSLFLHFENNSVFYRASIVKDIKEDFENTLVKCRERTLDDGGPGVKHSALDAILRLFSPLC